MWLGLGFIGLLTRTRTLQVRVVDLVADEGAVVEGDAVRQLLVREHDISRGHAHLHLVSVRVIGLELG